MGLFRATASAIRGGLTRSRDALSSSLASLRGRTIDAASIDELARMLLASDVGPATTDVVVAELKAATARGDLDGSDMLTLLQDLLESRLASRRRDLHMADEGTTVVLVVGVNGAGKTTTIAKMAASLKEEGRSVMLAAADTFRAGAVSQLATWADRLNIDCVRGAKGADPASITWDAADAATARDIDVLLVDTAGRLHTQEPLMRELAKIRDVAGRKIDGAPHEVLLVLDATQGQNALVQAREFTDLVDVTGIVLAKLDGTARGGIVFAIEDALEVPVKLVGLGERPQDIESFDATAFVDALIDSGLEDASKAS